MEAVIVEKNAYKCKYFILCVLTTLNQSMNAVVHKKNPKNDIKHPWKHVPRVHICTPSVDIVICGNRMLLKLCPD